MSAPHRRVIATEIIEGTRVYFCDDGTNWYYNYVYHEWVDDGPPPIPQPIDNS
jgi:hypothetical protein